MIDRRGAYELSYKKGEETRKKIIAWLKKFLGMGEKGNENT